MSEGLFLFLLATAVAFAIPAAEQPRWNVRRGAYAALAVICLLAIPLWGLVDRFIPSLTAVVANVAVNPSSWFTLIMVLFIVSLQPMGLFRANTDGSDKLAALQQQVSKLSHRIETMHKRPRANVNWAIWKQRSQYS